MKKKSYNGSIRGPQDWDKMLSTAYQMSLGQTREDTAKIVGVTRRTVYNWERGPFWDKALAEAHRRWCSGIVSSTKNAIAEALGDPQEYASMARFVAERMIKELRPPKQEREISGPDGKPIEVLTNLSDRDLLSKSEEARKVLLGSDKDEPNE